MFNEYRLWYESMIHDLRWFIFNKYKSFENKIENWRIWFMSKKKLWNMINENIKLSIDLEIDSFKSRHFENQLIITQRSNKKSFLILNVNKNEFKNNNMIDII